MLRRKPTAITITTEDITAFEDALSKNALPFQQKRHQRTASATADGHDQHQQHGASQSDAQQQGDQAVAVQDQQQQQQPPPGYIDPNDELKPLPGERARIVRTREERIMGRS